eukprot:gene10057-7027_t
MAELTDPHRAFLAVELPFCVPQSVRTEYHSVSSSSSLLTQRTERISDEAGAVPPWQKRKVESFLPSGILYQFIDADSTSHTPLSEKKDLTNASAKLASTGYDVGSERMYKAEPLWSTWRGTDWESCTATDDDSTNPTTREHGRNAKYPKMKTVVPKDSTLSRRDIFPSMVPQLLVNGYYRNDVLMKVRRKSRVRQIRSRKTGKILREEEVEGSIEGDGGDSAPSISTEVIGVVSRELEIGRPADFSFALFTPKERENAPERCGYEFFPPSHFITEKMLPEVRYEMGRTLNNVVMASEATYKPREDSQDKFYEKTVIQRDSDLFLLVQPTDPLPPKPLQAQLEFLKSIGSSPSGLEPDDPTEVLVVTRLLSGRPLWSMGELEEAIFQTGLCPSRNKNKRIIRALTYVLQKGPFNRLRIRLDYDPYRSPYSVIYQRLMIQLYRRSETGILLRDVSRADKLDAALQIVRTNPDNPIPEPWKLSDEGFSHVDGQSMPDWEHSPRCCAREVFARTTQRGQLSISTQIVDLLDLESFRLFVNVLLSDYVSEKKELRELSKEARTESFGWLSKPQNERLLSLFSSSLRAFIEDEVTPAINKTAGGVNSNEEDRQTQPDDEDDEEQADDEEEEDTDSSGSMAALGSSGSDDRGSLSDDSMSDEDDVFYLSYMLLLNIGYHECLIGFSHFLGSPSDVEDPLMEDIKNRVLASSDNPPDVEAFDMMMGVLSRGNASQVMEAQSILTQLKSSPNAFYIAIVLLTTSQQTATKFFGLQVIDEQINCFWNALDDATRTNIRTTIITEISKQCTSFQQIRQNKVLLTKLNSTLVSIAKREWPVRWPDFIKDICVSASPDHPMVENNLNLLRIVGEEVFEFGSKTLTSRWIERKKTALANDFAAIMLLQVVLDTLTEYIPWVDPSLVFDEPLLDHIASLTTGDSNIRAAAVRCLGEVVSLRLASGGVGDIHSQIMVRVFEKAMGYIVSILPTSHYSLMEQIVQFYESNPSQNYDYVLSLNGMLTSFMKNYYSRVYYNSQLILGIHALLVGMSNIFEKELFKACVEYWWWLGEFLLRSPPSSAKKSLLAILPRTLSDVRYVLIKRMAKPEEVIIVVDELEVRRESLQDVEELEMYKLMREALVFLTNLDSRDTREIMINLMQRQLDRSEWSWHNCNTLSWAVGAVSMAMSVDDETQLYNTIMQGLLKLCKEMEGSENRAVILSSILFVVGQYPRYLRTHKSFLHVVLKKIFDFMHENTIAGVQDMAVDTLLKLTKQLPKEFVELADNNSAGIAGEMADRWDFMTSKLNSSQICTCFRAVGYFLAVPTDNRDTLVLRFLNNTIANFKLLTDIAAQMGVSFCVNGDTSSLLHYLKVFSNIAETCKDGFLQPMDIIVQDLYGFYRLFTEAITGWYNGTIEGSPSSQAAQTTRALRREILRIFTRFVANVQCLDFVATCCLPDIFGVVLVDYQNCVPEAREAEALALVTECVIAFGTRIEDKCAPILDHTFAPTVAMISDSMESFPDFRVNLFKLLEALNEKCFAAFVQYSATNEDIVAAMLWAIKHTDYPTMTTGLDTLNTFVQNVANSEFAEAFFSAYMERIFVDVLVAAMDTLHAAGFPQHASILWKMFSLSNMVPFHTPIIGRQAVEQFLTQNLLLVPTLDPPAVASFLSKCFATCNDEKLFRDHLADFLIEAKVWGADQENRMQEEDERRAREETIPGFSQLSLKSEPNPFSQSSGSVLNCRRIFFFLEKNFVATLSRATT